MTYDPDAYLASFDQEAGGADKRTAYLALCATRCGEFRDHVAAMTVPEELIQWAQNMAVLHGPRVRVHVNWMGWLEALMVVRYGEAVVSENLPDGGWPTTFSDDDLKRAEFWQFGQTPAGVTYLPTADR